jgi:ABC-type sugar transport system substrate-binding protein
VRGVRRVAEQHDVAGSLLSAGRHRHGGITTASLKDQAGQLRALVAERHDCYVVNPITATNLVTALRGVRRPIVNVDSPVDPAAAKRAGVRIRTYIGTDDSASGRLAGAQMASLLPNGGDVALLGGIADNVNSGVRLSGFENGIRGSRVRVVARVNADYNRTKAQIAAARILRAHPRLSGFFAVSDSMVLGVADALRGAGKTGKIRVIGHYGNAEALAQVQGGSISADVSQYPYVMGQMAVKACVAATRGAELPARVDAPIALLQKGNVARSIAAFPRPVERYSDPFSRLLPVSARGRHPEARARGELLKALRVVISPQIPRKVLESNEVARQQGFAMAFGILLASLVVSSILVPALTALAGRRAWWPRRSARPRKRTGRLEELAPQPSA